MPYTTTNSEYDRIFGKKSLTLQLLKKIKAYLEDYKEESPYKELYEGINKCEPMAIFSCAIKYSDNILIRLMNNSIPCLMMVTKKGRAGFICLDKDADKIIKIQGEFREDMMNFMKQMTGVTMKKTMPASCPGLVNIKGLSKQEVYLMKELCRNTVKLSAIGIDHMLDDTYMLSFYADEIEKRSRSGLTVAQAYVLSKMMLHGKFNKIISERVERQERLETVIAENFDVNTLSEGKDLILVGDGNAYVKLTKQGIEVGYLKEYDGDFTFVPDENGTLRKEDNIYLDVVRSSVIHLSNPVIVTDVNDLVDVLRNSNALRSIEEIKEDMEETKLLSTVSDIIMNNRTAVPLHRDGEEEKKLQYMIRETAELIKSGISGEFSSEYNNAQIEKMVTAVKEANIDFSSINPALTILTRAEVEMELREEDLITDIDEYAQEYESPEYKKIREEISLAK